MLYPFYRPQKIGYIGLAGYNVLLDCNHLLPQDSWHRAQHHTGGERSADWKRMDEGVDGYIRLEAFHLACKMCSRFLLAHPQLLIAAFPAHKQARSTAPLEPPYFITVSWSFTIVEVRCEQLHSSM